VRVVPIKRLIHKVGRHDLVGGVDGYGWMLRYQRCSGAIQLGRVLGEGEGTWEQVE